MCLPVPALGSAGQETHSGLAPSLPGPFLSSEILRNVFTPAYAQGLLETDFIKLPGS